LQSRLHTFQIVCPGSSVTLPTASQTHVPIKSAPTNHWLTQCLQPSASAYASAAGCGHCVSQYVFCNKVST
jgi:hypothetical protein